MKFHSFLSGSLAAIAILTLLPTLHAGEPADMATGKEPIIPEPDPWAMSRRPISNPVYFDLTIPQTQIRPLFFYHNLPNHMNTVLGDVPVGGDVQLYALQIEWAINERWSINAIKDGYVEFKPDATLNRQGGFANIAAGLKYAWLLKPEDGVASNVQLIYEAPLGNTDVFQGAGDGALIPSLSYMKLWDRWQFVNQLGFKLPFDTDIESTVMFNSFHASYAITDHIFPSFEVNWFNTMSGGDGASRYQGQLGGAVPGAVNFEGGDVYNFGASNALRNRHLVTLGLGCRFRIPSHDNIDLGFAYEFPLTEKKNSIYRNRFIVDAVIRF